MADLLPLPGVGDVEQAVGRLDDRRVAVFSRLAFQHQGGGPLLPVFRHREVERTAAKAGVVVNQQMGAVAQRDGIGSGVGVGQAGERQFRPGEAVVRRGGGEDRAAGLADGGLERKRFFFEKKNQKNFTL